MQKKNMQSLIVGVVLYAFIVFCWMCTNSFIGDASLFPRMILILFAILNTIMVVQAFLGRGKEGKFYLKDALMPLAYFAGIVVYVLLFGWLGYFPATVIMLVALFLILKVRPYWLIAALTGGYCLFVYLLFVLWLKIHI